MKRFKAYLIAAAVVAVVLPGCKHEDPDRSPFDNKVFVSTGKTSEMQIKSDVSETTRTIRAGMAKPLSQELRLTFASDPALVSTYNLAYNDHAILLDTSYYELPDPVATIPAGQVASTEVTVRFKGIDRLARDTVYVLPVTLVSAPGIGILNSARTSYFIFKAGALINVVADIEKTYARVTWNNPIVVRNLTKVTMEALVRAKYFTRAGSDSQIASVMGIEGDYLIRFGDTNAAGQIQVATSRGNFPGKDETKVLSPNEWIHIAVTHDLAGGDWVIYVNGKKQSSGNKVVGSLNLTESGNDNAGFNIGRSWNDNRYWPGEIAEVRIWNVIRTQEQIANNFYIVSPHEPGLVAYWKFDDGAGLTVKDYSGNGNDAVVPESSPCKWNPVKLPPPPAH